MGIFKRQLPRATKFKGQYIFTNFNYGLYKQEVPRVLEEQIASLALVGGRNVWGLRGALTTQYGYETIGQLEGQENITHIPELSVNAQNILLVAGEENNIWRYNSIEGVKEYVTPFETEVSPNDFISCTDGNQLFLYCDDGNNSQTFYKFGGRYNAASLGEDADPVDIVTAEETEGKVYPTTNGFSIDVVNEKAKYFWLDKKLCVEDTADVYKGITVVSVTPLNEEYTRITFVKNEPITNTFVEGAHIVEKTLVSVDDVEFTYESTTPAREPIPIIPKIMAIVLNRLWVVDVENRIFYSAVGNFLNFEESNGAGFFEGFYNDSSPVLSIEEYFNGALVVKQNGMYHIKITTNEYSFNSGEGTVIAQSTSGNYLNINKLNNIPQKTAGDHCVIGDEVIAYDVSSGNLCRAVYINYYGNPQQGEILLHGSELDGENLGLYSATNRLLCYNFQEEVLLLYYTLGNNYTTSIVITRGLSIYPREIDKPIDTFIMFQQGIVGIVKGGLEEEGYLISDFKRGTTIPEVSSIAEFEPICLNGNKLLCGTILEITELNNEDYTLTTSNDDISVQDIRPSFTEGDIESNKLDNLLYSNTTNPVITSSTVGEIVDSSQQVVVRGNAKWVYQKSGLTRMAAPLSGRNGLSLRLEFEPNVTFQLVSIFLPDLSRGE